MKLEEKKIFEIINGTNKGIYSKADLKEALGGKKLDMIFDEPTVEAILDNFINTGKLHDLIPNENGIDILEGLLNNHIQTNLSDFYLIKPDYILSLPPEEQKNLANSISNGKQDLSNILGNFYYFVRHGLNNMHMFPRNHPFDMFLLLHLLSKSHSLYFQHPI